MGVANCKSQPLKRKDSDLSSSNPRSPSPGPQLGANMDKLMKLLRSMNLKEHREKACETYVKNNEANFEVFEAGIKVTMAMKSQEFGRSLFPLLASLNHFRVIYDELTAKQREVVSTFLSKISFCKVSYRLYTLLKGEYKGKPVEDIIDLGHNVLNDGNDEGNDEDNDEGSDDASDEGNDDLMDNDADYGGNDDWNDDDGDVDNEDLSSDKASNSNYDDGDLVEDDYNHNEEENPDWNDQLITVITQIRKAWLVFSVSSSNFGTKLYDVGIVEELFQDLKRLTHRDGQFLRGSATFDSAIGVLHNLAKVERGNLLQHFRDMKLDECLIKFLEFLDLKKLTLRVLLTLSYIIDEDKAKLLISKGSVFKLIISCSKLAWEQTEHRVNGFSLVELIDGMINLSKIDDIKRVLVKKQVLPLLSSILKKGNNLEKVRAAGLLWELSYDRKNKHIIKKDKELMKTVYDLRDKRESDDLSRACQGLLWVIKMRVKKAPEVELKTKVAASKGHIMISYQWSDQKRLKKVRDALTKKGYKVWMDIENMNMNKSKSILQAMAEAVENSAVVLMCVSEKYKKSPPCRSEAEYAYACEKPIIPLLMQSKYKANGWLGIIMGTIRYIDFSGGKNDFPRKMGELMKELEERQGRPPKVD